jgi:hypothetical protein
MYARHARIDRITNLRSTYNAKLWMTESIRKRIRCQPFECTPML